jgi:hypothetical protein
MFIVEVLFLVLAAVSTPLTVQDDLPPAVSEEPQAILERKQAHQDLLSRYRNAVGNYSFDVKELRKNRVPREEWPEAPIHEYFPRFVELAERGNGDSMFWVIESLDTPVPDLEERIRISRRYFLALAEHHSTEDYIPDVIKLLIPRRKILGAELVSGILKTIGQKCKNAETEAAAIYGEAMVIFDYGQQEDPEKMARVIDLWQVLVDGYQGTKIALRAADHLYRRLYVDCRTAQQEWVAEARKLHAQGVGSDEWPAYTATFFFPKFQALSMTGHMLSARWTEQFYPRCVAAGKEDIIEELRYVAAYIPRVEGPLSIYWMDLRFDILQLLVEARADEPWMFELVTDLESTVQGHRPSRYVPVLSKLIELTPDERIRYQAMLVMAQSLERGMTSDELTRALSTYQCIIDQSPVERLRKEAEIARRDFATAMPGALMPAFSSLDGEGLKVESSAYRGKVLMLYFWSYNQEPSLAEVPWVNDVYAKYQGRPFRVLGMNVDVTTHRLFANRSRKVGIEWRNALLQRAKGLSCISYHVAYTPLTFVIDAEGVIRGRALPHEEAEALVEELLAEIEADSDTDGK